MANNALNTNNGLVNGGDSTYAITYRGSNWYWAICAVMTVSTFVFIGLAYTKPRQQRVFHYITAGITMVAAIAYFTMGSGLGQVPIRAEYAPQFGGEYVAGDSTREIFYVRYIDWVITTPLLLLDLLLTAALPKPTILFVMLVDEVMIVTGLVGALVYSDYKWAYFVFGCIALFYILWILIWEARLHARALGPDISRVYLHTGALTAFLWLLYPIAWGLSEGGNVLSPDAEAGFYGALDLFAKPVFGAILLLGHRNIDPARLGLHIHDYDEKDAFVTNPKHNNGTTAAGTHTAANDTTATTTTAAV